MMDENGNWHYIVVLDITLTEETDVSAWDWNELLDLNVVDGEGAKVVVMDMSDEYSR